MKLCHVLFLFVYLQLDFFFKKIGLHIPVVQLQGQKMCLISQSKPIPETFSHIFKITL